MSVWFVSCHVHRMANTRTRTLEHGGIRMPHMSALGRISESYQAAHATEQTNEHSLRPRAYFPSATHRGWRRAGGARRIHVLLIRFQKHAHTHTNKPTWIKTGQLLTCHRHRRRQHSRNLRTHSHGRQLTIMRILWATERDQNSLTNTMYSGDQATGENDTNRCLPWQIRKHNKPFFSRIWCVKEIWIAHLKFSTCENSMYILYIYKIN